MHSREVEKQPMAGSYSKTLPHDADVTGWNKCKMACGGVGLPEVLKPRTSKGEVNKGDGILFIAVQLVMIPDRWWWRHVGGLNLASDGMQGFNWLNCFCGWVVTMNYDEHEAIPHEPANHSGYKT
jgi:hypothetical protein